MGGWRWGASLVVVTASVVIGAWRAPAIHRQIDARHGLLPPTVETGLEWVLAPEWSPLPNLPVAGLVTALALPLGLASAGALAAALHPLPIPVIDEPLHPAEPVAVGLLALASLVPLVIGVAVGGVITVHTVLWASRLAAPPARAVSHRRSATVVALVLTLLTAVVAGYGAVLVLARQLPWEAGTVGAALLPVALALLVGAAALRRTGRRRGVPVGLWELAPRLGPRRRVVRIARGTIGLMPGAEPLPPSVPPPGSGHPAG